MRYERALPLLLLASLCALPAAAQREVTLPDVAELDGDPVRTLLPPDAIPSIDAPELVPAAEADFMKKNEMVIGVVHGGVAKAYSLWHLDRHEVVNDWLGREPVAVTW